MHDNCLVFEFLFVGTTFRATDSIQSCPRSQFGVDSEEDDWLEMFPGLSVIAFIMLAYCLIKLDISVAVSLIATSNGVIFFNSLSTLLCSTYLFTSTPILPSIYMMEVYSLLCNFSSFLTFSSTH